MFFSFWDNFAKVINLAAGLLTLKVDAVLSV